MRFVGMMAADREKKAADSVGEDATVRLNCHVLQRETA